MRERGPPWGSSCQRRTAPRTACGVVVLAALTGCDDYNPAIRELPPSNAPSPPAELPPVQSGVFIDSSVAGLMFVSGQEQGVTDANGGYSCETGTDIEFSLGASRIGSAECTTLIMPPSLVPTGMLGDLQTLNITRFLLMLDLDGNPDNGISISDAVQQVASSWSQVDFSTTDLDADLVTIVSDAASVDGTPHAVPTATQALAHLDATASCAYAGAFAGPFAGDRSGAMAMVVGQRRPALEFQRDAFAWLAFDNLENWEFGGGVTSGVTLSARPAIEYLNGDDTMTATYVTPDRIAGSWDLPGGNHRASFDLERLGPTSGTFRFVGWMGAFRQDGALALSVDGKVVTGEAFDALRGRRGQLSGTLDGDVMNLGSDSQVVTTAVGTITFDQDGEPISVSGTWGRNGEFNAVACRLN